jgi:hypothetical protein
MGLSSRLFCGKRVGAVCDRDLVHSTGDRTQLQAVVGRRPRITQLKRAEANSLRPCHPMAKTVRAQLLEAVVAADKSSHAQNAGSE